MRWPCTFHIVPYTVTGIVTVGCHVNAGRIIPTGTAIVVVTYLLTFPSSRVRLSPRPRPESSVGTPGAPSTKRPPAVNAPGNPVP